MKIIAHIYDLVLSKGSASVPNLGIFKLQKTNALFDKQTNNLLPPSKEIGLELRPDTEDFSLIKYIAQEEQRPESEVAERIGQEVSAWKTALAQTGTLDLESLGTLTQNGDMMAFQGNRIANPTPDFYGLEEINLGELSNKSEAKAENQSGDYQFQKGILWLFLVIIPVLGIIVLAYTNRELLFGKASFDDISAQTSTPRIEDLPEKPIIDTLKIDSLKVDSLKIDTLKNNILPKP